MLNTLDPALEQVIRDKLSPLSPSKLEIIDDSHKHHGHPGVIERGGRHYRLIITSPKFNNISAIQKHKLIYQLLNELFIRKQIHALQIQII
jgi:BolA protein